MHALLLAVSLALLIVLTGGLAEAAPEVPSPDPEPEAREEKASTDSPAPTEEQDDAEATHSPVEREGVRSGDAARDVANVLLFVPRNVVDYLFRGTQAAANLVANEQLVPRYKRLLGIPDGGEFFVFPTLFAETGAPFSVGLRMVSSSRYVTTQQRFGFGGTNDVVVESRAVFDVHGPLPMAIAMEGFYELASRREYRGVGLNPARDPRNDFNQAARIGLYQERRVRYLGSFGLRLADPIEIYLSGSLQRRQIQNTDDVGPRGLSEVFGPDSIYGIEPVDPWIGYGEMAARLDTRSTRGRPVPGVLMEVYSGLARSFSREELTFLRLGWRMQGFIPIYRQTNILSPRIVVDRIVRLDDRPIPFYELPRQPDFRGLDTRRDDLSLVGGIDYSWRLTGFMNARAFVDIATVAPGIRDFNFEQIKGMRYAAGAGLDIFSTTATIASISLAGSPEGARVLFSLGAPDGFGDRQHRE